jgi:hypothetical protein
MRASYFGNFRMGGIRNFAEISSTTLLALKVLSAF